MKKDIIVIIIAVLVLIVGLIGIYLYRNANKVEPKYSHDEIFALIQKGLTNMNNIYAERTSLDTSRWESNKAWYLNGKYKIETDKTVRIINLSENKMYIWEKNNNLDKVIETQVDTIKYVNDEGYAGIMNRNRVTKNETIEFRYMGEEICQGKDCIKFKTIVSNSFTGSLIDYGEAYWIDKESGLILGYGVEPLESNEIVKIYEYTNISIGTLTEEDFKLPEDRVVSKVDLVKPSEN